MAGPTIVIQPPTRRERTGGIEQVAEFRLNERLAAGSGVTFQSDGCEFPKISEHLCYRTPEMTVPEDDEDPEVIPPADKEFGGINILDGIGEPFPLYAGVKCSLGPDRDDFDDRAQDTLLLGRSRELEAALAAWAAGATAGTAGANVKRAIANVEQYIDANYVAQGIVLMSRADTAEAELELDGSGMLRTSNGTPVIASGRIAPGTVYGVGAVSVEHSSVETRDVLDPITNTHWALAEQVFSIAVDCEFRTKSTITS